MNVTVSGRTIGIGLLCCGAALVQGCAKKVAIAKPAATPPVTASAPAQPEASRPTVTPQTTPTTTAPTNRASGPDQATKDRIQALLDRIQDAYFDYNADTIRKDAQTMLYNDSVALSEIMRQYPNYKLTIEGYCDERGSGEYNLALGDTRAKNAKQYLVTCGIAGDQIKTVSLGKERQVCSDHNETCWQKNRRIHVTQG
jgi:peptidoglycan-associated lipoprotein